MNSSNWYIINIKARRDQSPEHYVRAFDELVKQDPLVNTWRDRFVSIASAIPSNESCNGVPSWLIVKFISYVIIDKDAFYSRREQQKVNIEWDDDIVANFKETECIFIPSCHKLAVGLSSKIPYKSVASYLQKALDDVEPETFDVTVCINEGFIREIREAYALIKVEAKISYSNPTSTDDISAFHREFDKKLRESGVVSADITLNGTKKQPLMMGNDSLTETILSIAEADGSVTATIQSDEDGPYKKVNSGKHPLLITFQPLKGEFWGSLYNTVMSWFNHG